MYMNLDWSKINNDKDFQRLSNALFAFETNYSDFTPSSPYIGADGGWDGRWEGSYESLVGLFSIQAKWTTKNHNEAFDYLKSKIPKEVTKAEKQGVNHLIITTNAELRVEHITELQKLKGNKLDTLQVWHREKLTYKLVKHAYLCHEFFGKPQFPAFVPPSTYFDEIESKLLKAKLIGRDDDLSSVQTAISGSDNRVIVIHAPGGFGKSHFLKELCQRINDHDKERFVLVVKRALRKLRDAFQDELVAGDKYVLVLDDADRASSEDLEDLIGFAYANPSIKLILGCRTAGLPIVKHALYNQRIEFNEKELKQLKEEELIEILHKAAEREHIEKAKRIIKALDGIPFLIVLYGRLIRKELTEEEIEKINDSLAQSVLSDSYRVLSDILSKTKQEELLLHLATIIPFSVGNYKVEKLTTILDVQSSTIENAIQKLIEAKILRYVGKTIRFYPDMIGDLYLAKRIEMQPGMAKKLLDTWLSDFSNNVLSNLGSAAPYEKNLAISTVLGQLIKSWVDKAAYDSAYERSSNLEKLQRIAHLAPKDALDLVYAYLEARRHDPKESDYPNLDNYGPIVEIIGILPEFQIEALNLIKTLADSGLGGTYENYKIETLTRNLVKPTIKSLNAIEVVLKEIVNWCNSLEISNMEAYIAAEAAKEILACAHEYTESFGRTLTIGQKIVRDIPEVHQLRDLGMEIFKFLLYSKDHVRLAIEIANDIGDSRTHRVSPDEVPLAKRIRKDKDSALDLILQLDFDVLSLIAVSDTMSSI